MREVKNAMCGRSRMRLMITDYHNAFRDPVAKKQYVCVLIYLPANPLAIRPPGLRSSPHQAARHKPANPPVSTQCLARNARNPLELAGEHETMNLPTDRRARASRARIARASRPHRARGGGGAPARRARFIIIITPATTFFAVLPPCLRASVQHCPHACGLPRPHACVPIAYSTK